MLNQRLRCILQCTGLPRPQECLLGLRPRVFRDKCEVQTMDLVFRTAFRDYYIFPPLESPSHLEFQADQSPPLFRIVLRHDSDLPEVSMGPSIGTLSSMPPLPRSAKFFHQRLWCLQRVQVPVVRKLEQDCQNPLANASWRNEYGSLLLLQPGIRK